MAIFELKKDGFIAAQPTTFGDEGIKERSDLQRLLRSHVGVIAPGVRVISEEFGDWADSKRRIDLLGIDEDANLIVIELKRTEDGGHVELQALRYAAMVSKLTFDETVQVYETYLKKTEAGKDASQELLAFLGWSEPDEAAFNKNVKIVLAGADFSNEVTSTVLWLREYGLDITCVRMRPCKLADHLVVDVQPIIPLPEVAEYQVHLKHKMQQEREAKQSKSLAKYDVCIQGEEHLALSKRLAIYLVARELVQNGVSPEDVAAHVPWRAKNMWVSVEGEIGNTEEFVTRATIQAQAQQRGFDPKRWFLDPDQLIFAQGRTYAFSNQWGKQWSDGMDLLSAAYPQFKIVYHESNAVPGETGQDDEGSMK